MNIIINAFGYQPLAEVVTNICRVIRIEYCHLIRVYNFSIETNNDCKTEYQEWQKIILGEYDIDWNDVKPLDEKLINQMSHCELAVLAMMDRFETGGIKLSYKDRKKIYLNHLRYWNWILDRNNIDLFFSFNVPHEGYDFVIYSLCQVKKIKTLYFYPLPINGALLLIEDWENPAQEINQIYKKMIQQTKIENQETKYTPQMALKFKQYYEMQVSVTSDPIPFYMKKETLRKNIGVKELKFYKYSNIFQKLLTPQYWQIKLYWLQLKLINETRLFKFYENNASNPDISQKYIYLPLHFQPEATTSPLAGAFINQLLIVQLLAYAIPDDFFIYVKEHPNQTIFGRNIDFYKNLLNIPKVKLVPKKYNSFRLLENCVAVATATGTAGWEGLFRKKPVLMFGHHFYQYAYGVFQISSLEDCSTAINQIINKKINLDSNQIFWFLKALETIAISGYTSSVYREVSGISEAENIENLSKAIISNIQTRQL